MDLHEVVSTVVLLVLDGIIDVQFFLIFSRKGGPALRTTPARIYSKHDVKNSAVFSEFLMLDFPAWTLGGMNL